MVNQSVSERRVERDTLTGEAGAFRIALLAGDGIGQGVVDAARRVMRSAALRHRVRLVVGELPSRLAALRTHGGTLPDETRRALPDYEAGSLGQCPRTCTTRRIPGKPTRAVSFARPTTCSRTSVRRAGVRDLVSRADST